MKRKNDTIKVNKLIFVVLGLSFFAIVFQLFCVALKEETNGINLTKFVQERNTDKTIIKASRGAILSTDGEVLAQSINSYTVIAYLSPSRTTKDDNPKHVVNKEYTAESLSGILGMDKEYILRLLNKDLYQVELGPNGRGITETIKKQIENLDLPGIDFIETSKRYYTMGPFASYIIGYAKTNDEGDIVGEMGIEGYYNSILEGKDGSVIAQKDPYGYTMPNSQTIREEADPGQDIYLTLDSKIQLFLENGIKELTNAYDMSWLTFSVVDAKTGAIVATSSSPNFNPNTLEIESYLNPLTSYTYEPGSTMKIYSFLAAMENGLYDGNATYQSGTIRVDDANIKDFNNVGWGVITYDSGFAYSSNTAATNLALTMGRDKLHDFYKKIGFGAKTGISLPNELTGDIDFTYATEIATASFGQGITTTPIQNLQALTMLANGGVELQPYIVEKIVNRNTGEVTFEQGRTELGAKIKKENADKMLSLMYDVVYSGKTDAKFFQSDTVKLVGKTGTAQIAGPNGQYLTGTYDYVKSFAGLFPYDDPQYVIYISVKQFQGNFRSVAEMVTKVVDEIAKYKNITELTETIDTSKIVIMENYVSHDVLEIEEKLKTMHLDVVRLGGGKYVVKQYPVKGQVVLAGNKVFLVTNDKNYVLPDITGWSSSEVSTLCKLMHIEYKSNGYGKVVSFHAEVGTPITTGMVLEVNLEP